MTKGEQPIRACSAGKKAGIRVALQQGMELLGRVATAVGISLVLTLLMLVLYQDDGAQLQPAPASISQTADAR